MMQQRNIFQTKEWNKASGELSDVEIGNLLKKEFRVVIIKMMQELGRRMNGEWEVRGFWQRVRK